MMYLKWYCLRCERPNNCNCVDKTKEFYHSPKCRAPLNTRNKERFRRFLRSCPIFVNCVPEELYEDFRNLLRKVKWKGGVINGKEWTKI